MAEQKPKRKEKVQMATIPVRLPQQFWQGAKDKAGLVPVSKYLRTLVIMWVKGEIVITDDDVKKYS